jgi:2-polyprenyl-3-methyl-5-hydroxy-6-metoxy-1,4-benzoquinol methylase
MKEAIDKKRWEEAQVGEKLFHIKEPVDVSYNHYRNTYNNYFSYLDIDPDLRDKKIIEIGPGRIAGLLFCDNYQKSYIIEPTEYDDINHLYEDKNLEIIKKTVEDIDLPQADEVWIFNLMQHVQDPDLLIEKCKKAANIIR